MPERQSLLLVGGPDTGKSNFLGSLWMCLREGEGRHKLEGDPQDIQYIQSITHFLWRGEYAPRSEKGGQVRDFQATIVNTEDGSSAEILVPDVDGELWKTAADDREIPREWIQRIQTSSAALLFVRVGSTEIVGTLDWVSAATAMAEPSMRWFGHPDKMPTQVFLTDVLNLLEEHLGSISAQRPRLAIIVSAWDLLPKEDAEASPLNFLAKEFPMLAGRLDDEGRLEIRVFGVSATGGDLDTEEDQKKFQKDPAKAAYSVVETGGAVRRESLTAAVDWALGHDL